MMMKVDFAKVVSQVPQLARGQVWCRTCGFTERVDSGSALSTGWPKCCGRTMTIDSPEEQARITSRATG
jgi:hypothetical protein